MSDPTPGAHPPADPKAAAKAAIAYAKASRRWYQKKRWWLAAGAVAIVVIIAAASGGGSNGPKKVDAANTTPGTGAGGSSHPPAGAAGSETDGTKEHPVKVGETVELAGTRYTVKKVTKASSVGGAYGAKADGVFVVVTLTIENMRSETTTFSDSAATLNTADGTSYSADDDGSIYADDALILADMQPQLPKTGTLVFDVPPAKTAGIVLKVSDLFGDGDAYIDLGLH